MKGRFIVFEGLDGSGLSTQADMLRDYLIDKGNDVVLTKEQTDSLIGGLIKSHLKEELHISPIGLQLLFAADRANHLAIEIEPSIEAGKIVICDRYILSSFAFGLLDVDLKFLKQINSKFRRPDLTFIIDASPDICLKRIKKSRSHIELFEKKEKLQKIRENYISLKDEFPNIHVIDGNKEKNKVFDDIKKIVDEIIG